MMSDVREWKLDSHSLRFEPPDILFHKVWGSASLKDCREFMAIYRELGSRVPVFAVVDMSEAARIEEDARRYVSENLQTEWFAGVIYVRARLVHKAVAKGITIFLRLIGKPSVDPHFVSTEEEARDLIARLREQGTAREA
jgi:hypothetical protein